MNLLDLAFYFFAVIILASAWVVARSKNIMYSAFSLLFTFFGVAGLYVLLNADFLAITQIVIYIGGILVLIIFGVMLTSRVTGVDIKEGPTSKVQGYLIGFVTLVAAVALSVVYWQTDWNTSVAAPQEKTIDAIGNILMTDYLIAFEVASVLLLIAIIGAALIARKKTING